MRTRFAVVGLAAALAAALFAAANAEGEKKHPCKCPLKMEGVEVQVANIENGVTLTATAKDPETVKKLQGAMAEHMAKKEEHKAGCPGCKKEKKQ
jgi:hypothetical protein